MVKFSEKLVVKNLYCINIIKIFNLLMTEADFLGNALKHLSTKSSKPVLKMTFQYTVE